MPCLFLLLLYGRSALLLLTTSWSVRKESKNRCPPTMQNPCRMEKRLIVSSGVNLSVNCFFFLGCTAELLAAGGIGFSSHCEPEDNEVVKDNNTYIMILFFTFPLMDL